VSGFGYLPSKLGTRHGTDQTCFFSFFGTRIRIIGFGSKILETTIVTTGSTFDFGYPHQLCTFSNFGTWYLFIVKKSMRTTRFISRSINYKTLLYSWHLLIKGNNISSVSYSLIVSDESNGLINPREGSNKVTHSHLISSFSAWKLLIICFTYKLSLVNKV